MKLTPLKSRVALQSFCKAYLKKRGGGRGRKKKTKPTAYWTERADRVQDERKLSDLQNSAGRKSTDKIIQL